MTRRRHAPLSHGLALGLILAGCLMAAAGGAQSLEVIELRYRTAAEVIPVLQPLLEPGGALSGKDYHLFVRTSSANLAQLRAALAQLDRQPRPLFISVRRSTQEEIEREGAAVSGTLRSGDGAISVNEERSIDTGATVHATQSHTRTRDGGVASVQVLEGNSAFIETGSSIPVVTIIAGGTRRHSQRHLWVAASTDYRELGSGFVVTPRLNADGVVLDIAQHDDRLRDGIVRTQELTTQVSGRLGEWIELGGISESAVRQRSGILDRQYATRSDASSIWVKVEAR